MAFPFFGRDQNWPEYVLTSYSGFPYSNPIPAIFRLEINFLLFLPAFQENRRKTVEHYPIFCYKGYDLMDRKPWAL
jgi:hypothetical protein